MQLWGRDSWDVSHGRKQCSEPRLGSESSQDELPVPVSVQKGIFAPAKKPKRTGMSEEKK